MSSGEIKLNGKAYQVKFTMSVIKDVMKELNLQTFDELQEKAGATQLISALESASIIAFYGIRKGMGNACPFQNADDMADEVKHISELTAVMPLWWQAFNDLFAADEDAPTGELTGAKESP